MAQEKELGRFKKTQKEGDTDEIVISTGVYGKSPEHLDVREFYKNANGEMKPTRSGARTDITNASKVLLAVSKAFGNADFETELEALLKKYELSN